MPRFGATRSRIIPRASRRSVFPDWWVKLAWSHTSQSQPSVLERDVFFWVSVFGGKACESMLLCGLKAMRIFPSPTQSLVCTPAYRTPFFSLFCPLPCLDFQFRVPPVLIAPPTTLLYPSNLVFSLLCNFFTRQA